MKTSHFDDLQRMYGLMDGLPQGLWQSFRDGAGNLCIGCGDTPIAFVPPGPMQQQITEFLCACAPASIRESLEPFFELPREPLQGTSALVPAAPVTADDAGSAHAGQAPISLQGGDQDRPIERGQSHGDYVQPDLSDAGIKTFFAQFDDQVLAFLQALEQDEIKTGKYKPSVAGQFVGGIESDRDEFIRHLVALSPAQCLVSCLAMDQDDCYATARMLAQAQMLHALDRRGNPDLLVQRFNYLQQGGVLRFLWKADMAQTIARVLRILVGGDGGDGADDAAEHGETDAVNGGSEAYQPRFPF